MPIINTRALADARARKPVHREQRSEQPEAPRLQVPEDRSVVAPAPTMPKEAKPTSSAVAGTGLRKSYAGVAIDNEITPITSLSAHIEGYEDWIVDAYYNQIVGRDDSLKPFSIDLNSTHQQYNKINKMALKVTDPLSYEYQAEQQRDAFTGRAVIQGNTFIPNRYDVFTAQVRSGVTMLFSITSVTPMSVMTETAYEIEYNSIDRYGDKNAAYLENKVINTYLYSRDLLQRGRHPLIHEKALVTRATLIEHGNRLVSMYISDFASRDRRYLSLPDQKEVVVDLYVQKIWYELLNTTEYPELRHISWLSMESVSSLIVPTLWDALMKKTALQSKGVKYQMCKEMVVTPTHQFVLGQSNPTLIGVHYRSIDSLVSPPDSKMRSRTFKELMPSVPRIDRLEETIEKGTVLDGSALTDQLKGEIQDIYGVQEDKYYVLSRHFYEHDLLRQSKLERLVTDYLEDRAVNADTLSALCDKAYNWGSLERYYYVPILMILLDHRLNQN